MEKLMIERDQATKEVSDVLLARWAGFIRLAQTMKGHHILGVELVRTLNDETVAVLVVAEHGKPVKYAVTGDAHGRVIPRDRQPRAQQDSDCHPTQSAMTAGVTHALEARIGPEVPPQDPAFVAMGHPPPETPTPPGVAAVGEALLNLTFNAAENVPV